jgi:hypothetical protein
MTLMISMSLTMMKRGLTVVMLVVVVLAMGKMVETSEHRRVAGVFSLVSMFLLRVIWSLGLFFSNSNLFLDIWL